MKRIAGLLAFGACAATCAGTVRTVTAPALALDTRIGLLKVVEDAATLRLSTRWDGASEGVLTVNGVEAARLGADAEADHVLTDLAPGEYVCSWTTGASTSLATFCVRGGVSVPPPSVAGVKTGTAVPVVVDARIGLYKEVAGSATLRLSTWWADGESGVLTVNGEEVARLGAAAEGDYALESLAPGEYVCAWSSGAVTNLATLCVRGVVSVPPPGAAGVKTGAAAPVSVDARIGLYKEVPGSVPLRLSTRWDGTEAGVLTVNGAEAARLGADAEADHVLVGLAPGEYVCQWTTGASTNLATFCVRGGASALPPDGAGVRTATAAAIALDTRIGLVKVVEGAAPLRLSTRWDGTEAGTLTVNGVEAARLGAAEEADHVLDGLAPGEYVCSWATGASTSLATFCVRGGASALPPGATGVQTATAAAIALDTRIGLVKVVEDTATLRLSTRWDGVPEGVLTVNGEEVRTLGAVEEAGHVLDGLAPGEYVCQWTTGASTNLATFCVRGGVSVLPSDATGVQTATTAPVALDTRIGLYKVLPVSERGVASVVCRLSTRWDGAESGTLTVNGEEVRTLGASEESDHRLDNLAPGEYVCRWTAGAATYLATFSVRGDGSAKPPRTDVEVTITGHTTTYPYDGREKRAGGFDVAISDPLYTTDDFVFTGCSNAVRTAVGTTAFGMTAADFANVNPNFSDVVFHVADGSVTVTPGVVVNPFDPDDPSAPVLEEILAGVNCVTNYDGVGHAIDVASRLNPSLVADGASISYSLDPTHEPFTTTNPVFTNVVSTSVWYRIVSANFASFTTNALLVIAPRPITLAAPTRSKPYDGTPLTFNAADIAVGGDGYAPGERFDYLDFARITDVGESPATFTYRDSATAKVSNYAVTVVGGRTLTVTKLPTEIVVTAKSGTWVYDGEAHALHDCEATNLDALRAGDGLVVSYDAASAVATPVDGPDGDGVVANIISDVRILRNGRDDVSRNYTLTVRPGTLAVTRRPVTLTSKSGTKAYDGTPLVAHGVTVGGMGFVGDDGATYAFTGSQTERGTGRNTFTYALTDGTNASYYEIATVAGELTVTAADISAGEEDDWEVVLGPALVYTGLEQVQMLASVSYRGLPVDYETTGDTGTAAGAYRMTLAGRGNFTGTREVAWAIAPRPVTVRVTGHTATHAYDGAEKSVSGYDLATDDALYGLSSTAFGGTAAASRTDAGRRAMGLSAADFTNGDGNFDVTYVVTDGWVLVKPLDISGADDFALALGANPKYSGAEQAVSVLSATCRGLPVTHGLTGASAVHAGAYTLTLAGTGNFTGSRSAIWRILPRAVTLTSGSASKVYDGTPLVAHEVAVGGDGFVAGEGATFNVTGSRTVAGTGKNVFTYALKAGTLAGDYAIETVEGDLTVTKATYSGQEPGGAGIAWSVAADAAMWVYDGRPHGVTLTGVPTGVTAHLTGNAATDAGGYVATVTLDYDAANYEPPVVPAPLRWSITPRPLTLMAASKEKPYDGFPLTVRPGDITASGGGYADGECLDYFDFASITDVGEIPATFGYRDSATAKVSNYAVTVVGGQTLKVTVGGDQISVTADSGTWAYDGAAHRAATWCVLNGDRLVAGHELRVAVDPTSVVRTPKDGPDGDGIVSNRFASVRIVETATGADRTRNYNLVLREGVLQVTNACIRAEWLSGTADVEKAYDGAATQAVVTAALLRPAAVRYAVGETLPADGWSAEPPSLVHAGTQTVWYAVSADYYEPYTNGLRVLIAPRPITLATPTKAKTYDGAPLTFGADEVTVGGDGYAPGESFALSGFASLADAGRIAARCAYAAGAGTRLADYAVTETWGTLTVLASADEITVTAADGSWSYDGTVHALPAYTAENADKLRPGDELVVSFDPASAVLTPEDGPNGDGIVSNVIMSVRVVRNGTADVTRNYSLAWYPGTLRVTRARITFDREGSVDPSAFSTSATYDGAGHTAAVVPPALLTGPVTVRYGASSDAVVLDAPPAFTNAGIHTVFYTLDAPYYETYAGTATVTVSPRPVTLVSAGAEKVYDGTPIRADAVQVKEGSLGFVGDEGFAATCRGALTDVGAMENLFDYALTGGTLAGNYAVSKEYGWLRVTPATLDPGAVFGGGETDADGGPLCARVYNGAPQPFAPAPDFGEPYRLSYALVPGDESAYSETAPTRTHVAEGDLAVYFKFLSPNYAPYYGTGVLRIAPKALTDAMVVADEDSAWFFDGTEKRPAVTVVDGSPNAATADDWTVAYSGRTGAGLFPVTVTGRNDYCGTVTKEFAILKRPVAPPVIPSKAYSGRLQKPGVPSDARWTVVANPGGTDAGDYTNVVLRLTAPADYRWKGLGEDEPDWTGVFTIRRGANGWSVRPGISGWTNGVDAASAPVGRPRFGTLSVAYRRRGAPVETESPVRPSAPGRYTARFWAEETANYAGVALATPYEVDFEIFPGPGDPPAGAATATTPVPVPYAWLDAYIAHFGAGDYEAAANAVGANGVALWESYVAGLDPTDAASRFTALISLDADGAARVTWTPDLSGSESPRTYTVYGKAGLGDADWTPVTDANRARMRFFRVRVELK